ncbi:MAG: NUDIX domain-containing protein [Bacteroidia bacterium]
MKEPEILSRRKIFDGFFALEEVEVRNDAGGERLLRHLVVPKKAVAVLVYNKDKGLVVFSKQYRLAAEQWLLEIPAGVMDGANESPMETARRECQEETGYVVESLQSIVTYFPSPGNSAEKIHLYFAEVQTSDKISEGGGLDHEHENIKVVEMDFKEALKMAETGDITDGKTLLALFWLARKLNK